MAMAHMIEAEAILAPLHCNAQRMISACMGKPYEGLAMAANAARKAGRIDNRIAKKLVRLDIAFAMIRRTSQPRADQLTKQLAEALEPKHDEKGMPKEKRAQTSRSSRPTMW